MITLKRKLQVKNKLSYWSSAWQWAALAFYNL